MTRRAALAALLVGGVATAFLTARSDGPRTAVALDGAFLTPLSSAGDTEALLADFARMGLTKIVLTETRPGTGACDSLHFPWAAGLPAGLAALAETAKKQGLELWLGGPRLPPGCAALLAKEPPEALLAAWDQVLAAAPTSIAGYYIADEPAASSLAGAEIYFSSVRRRIAARSARPTLVAPYIGGGAALAPADLARAARHFAEATGIEVQAWQDSVGVRGFRSLKSALSETQQAWAALQEALPKGRFATVTELFAAGELATFDSPLGYKPAPISRLAEQLAIIPPAAAMQLAWLPQKHMTAAPLPGLGDGPPALRAGYLALLGRLGQLPQPAEVQPDRPPDDRYRSFAAHKIPGQTPAAADPGDASNGGWAGWTGPVTLRLPLASKAPLSRLTVHLLNQPAWGVRVPSHITVTCRPVAATTAGERVLWSSDLPKDAEATEYVASSPDLQQTACAELTIRLENDAWTFLGGVTLINTKP